jgi:hypothetical protein
MRTRALRASAATRGSKRSRKPFNCSFGVIARRIPRPATGGSNKRFVNLYTLRMAGVVHFIAVVAAATCMGSNPG